MRKVKLARRTSSCGPNAHGHLAKQMLGVPRRFAWLGVAGGLLLTGFIGVSTAHAGTYVMRNCDVPGYGYAGIGPWFRTTEQAPNSVMVDRCASGGGAAFAFAGLREMPDGLWATLALARPAQGPQSQIKLVKATLWYAARLAGSGNPINLSSLDLHSDGTFSQGVSNGPPGAENLVLEQQFNPVSTTAYKIFVICGPLTTPRPAGGCVASSDVPLLIRGMEVTLSEDVPPTVSQPDGTLVAGGPQSGARTLRYAASDPQSGVAKVEVLFDDTVVASRDLTSQCSYSDFTVCPISQSDAIQIDTAAVANGSHRVTLRVQDAAGNERVINVPNTVEIANVTAPGASALGASIAPLYTLTARFEGSSRSTLTVPYGRRVAVAGSLAGETRPIPAGTQIEILERLDRRGGREGSSGHLRTEADGSFSYVLPTNRPSRTLRLMYRPTGGSPTFSTALRLRVRAASSLRALLRGRVIRFSGRVRSGPIPKGGKTVRMEGYAPGSAWNSFKTLHTDRRGRFSGTYRLPIRRPGVRLKIRAAVPSEGGYGYLAARSRAVTLRVR